MDTCGFNKKSFKDGPIGAGQHLREVLSSWKKTTGYHRAVGIGINNLIDTTLENPQFWLESGRVEHLPIPRVDPNQASASFFTKKGGAARGTVGILCYDIIGTDKRLAMMWSIPFSYTLYSNWFNVHIIDQNIPVDWKLFWRLYKEDPVKAKDGLTLRSERNFKISAEMENLKIANLIVTIQAI